MYIFRLMIFMPVTRILGLTMFGLHDIFLSFSVTSGRHILGIPPLADHNVSEDRLEEEWLAEMRDPAPPPEKVCVPLRLLRERSKSEREALMNVEQCRRVSESFDMMNCLEDYDSPDNSLGPGEWLVNYEEPSKPTKRKRQKRSQSTRRFKIEKFVRRGLSSREAEDAALQKARNFREDLERQKMLKPHRELPERQKSLMPGVIWDPEKEHWQVKFSVKKTTTAALVDSQIYFQKTSIKHIHGGAFPRKKYAERRALQMARQPKLFRLVRAASRVRWHGHESSDQAPQLQMVPWQSCFTCFCGVFDPRILFQCAAVVLFAHDSTSQKVSSSVSRECKKKSKGSELPYHEDFALRGG